MISNAQCKWASSGDDLSLVHADDTTLCYCNWEDERLLIMSVDGCVYNLISSASLHAESFYHFRKKALSAYCDLQDCVSKARAMDGTEPVSFREFLNDKPWITAKLMPQSLNLLQPYLKAVSIYICDENEKGQLRKGMNKEWLERALQKPNTLSFRGLNSLSVS